MKLRDLFSDDAIIEPRAEAVTVSRPCRGQPQRKAGRPFFRSRPPNRWRAFVDAAIAAGAAAIAGEHPPQGVRGAVCRDAQSAPRAGAGRGEILSTAARNHRGGHRTSGKTSVAAFTRQIWQRLGHTSASIGTIGLVSPKRTVYGSLTTPDPIALHRQLDEIAGEGVTHLAFEASSHGLDQYRLDGVRIAAGGFTNLSRDHMDYHPDVAHYLAAKLRLFELVAAGGAAVISADHDCSKP